MLKSIKDSNATNFDKLSDNVNFELNGRQTVKPNLKNINAYLKREFLIDIFGGGFVSKIEKFNIDIKDQANYLNEDGALSKVKECKNDEDQKNVFDFYILSKLKNELNLEQYKEIKDELYKYQEELSYVKVFNKYLKLATNLIENYFTHTFKLSDLKTMKTVKLEDYQISKFLEKNNLKLWEHKQDRDRKILEKKFYFGSYAVAWKFYGRLARVIDLTGHGLEWMDIKDVVTITLSTKDCGGVSVKDLVFAWVIDRMLVDESFDRMADLRLYLDL